MQKQTAKSENRKNKMHYFRQRGEEDKFNGYSEFQKVHSSIKTRCLSDTLKQDELRKEENWSSY